MYKIFETVDEVSFYTAQRILKTVQAAPNAVLGLATGSTMEPVYAHFLRLIQQHSLDVSQLTTLNLDEYIGLRPEHEQSYHYYMQKHLFSKLAFSKNQIHLPGGTANDFEAACQAYSEATRALGGLNLQLLGIGNNGHIGFNEPHTSFSSRTHMVELSQQTRIDNGRFFADQNEVPTHAVTLGIQDIIEADEILLVITGHHKADIVAKLFYSPVDEALPASVLKRHLNLTIVLDPEEASLMSVEALAVSA